MAGFSKDLGIDLGTIYTRIAEGSQIIVEEPTVVAIDVADQKIVEVGRQARDMEGRVPDTIEVARPLQNGVIADYEITESLLRVLLQRVSGPVRIFKPNVMISVPYGVTSVDGAAFHAGYAIGNGNHHIWLEYAYRAAYSLEQYP